MAFILDSKKDDISFLLGLQGKHRWEEPPNTLTTPTSVASTMDTVWLKKRFLTKFRSANFVQSSDGAHIHCVGNCRYYDISTKSAKKRASFWTRSRDISSLASANAIVA